MISMNLNAMHAMRGTEPLAVLSIVKLDGNKRKGDL